MAKKKNRKPRPKADLLREMGEHIDLLRRSCETFDEGTEHVGKFIALSLRTLLNQHGRNRSLLDQVGLRGAMRFMDTAGDLNPRNLATDNLLCAMHLTTTPGETKYIPNFSDTPFPPRQLRFAPWWSNPVIKDNKKRRFSRMQLVLDVAGMDAGHVDPELEEAYMALSRENSLGWVIGSGGEHRPFPSPVMPSIRQIAHEVLVSLEAAGVTTGYNPPANR